MNKKNNLKYESLIPWFSLVILVEASCKGDIGNIELGPPVPLTRPSILLDAGPSYVGKDTTVNAGAVVTIGVRTAIGTNKQVLTSLIESVAYDGHADSIIQQIAISAPSNQTYYNKDFVINTRKVQGAETYKFDLHDQANEVESASVTITTK